MNADCRPYTATPSYDGKRVNLTLSAWPMSLQLSQMTPADARQLGLTLIAVAARCDQAVADDQRVRDIALESAMAADERAPA